MKSRFLLLPLLTLIAIVSTAVYNPAEKALDAVVGISETAVEVVGSAIENHSFAPAPAPNLTPYSEDLTAVDTLPKGRHKVSSHRNGSSTEVVVEDQEIKELIIDGEVIPESDYDEHQEMVERLLGTSSRSHSNSWHWSDGDAASSSLYRLRSLRSLEGLKSLESLESLESLKSLESIEGLESLEGLEGLERLKVLKSLEGLEGLEGVFLDMSGNWEELGERLGEMGDEIGRSFEGVIELHGDGKAYRFNIDQDSEPFFFDSDSISKGGAFRFNSDRNIWELDGKVIRPNSAQDRESEIEEMETMIERLERRKAQMQRDLERTERDGAREERDQERSARDHERRIHEEERAQYAQEQELREHEMHEKNAGPDYEDIVSQLQREGLLQGNDPLKKLFLGDGKLKVNGKKASGEAYQRFLEVYKKRYGKNLAESASLKVTINN